MQTIHFKHNAIQSIDEEPNMSPSLGGGPCMPDCTPHVQLNIQ